ncbi:MAG: VOC family protein [Tepidisphaeraceae bacterium]
MPSITGLIETALYVTDMPHAVDFYQRVLGFETLRGDERFHAFSVASRHVLLLFLKGGSLTTQVLPGGTIPPHDGSGPVHIGFTIDASALAEWEQRLANHGVTIEGRTTWDRGGTSIYFRDPDGHLLELLTPGVWTIY